jgi:hypothetical protein
MLVCGVSGFTLIHCCFCVCEKVGPRPRLLRAADDEGAWTRIWSARTFAVGSVMDWSPSRLRPVAFSRHLVFQFFRTRVFKGPSQDSKSSFSNHFKASVRCCFKRCLVLNRS